MTPLSRFRSSPLLASTLSMATMSLATASLATMSLAAVSLGAALPGRADGHAPQRLTAAQESQIFPERKAALLRHRRERIEVLQNGERCIGAARDTDALRTCMQEEWQQQRVQRQKHREAMGEIYARSGITAPTDRQGGGGWGKGRWGR